ncbi:hypothetical protein OS175_13675 [Marinicella sp. S1101]|nr:hypothetical protein [Marinicella marina]MCX7554924.1 hypothetical protein [Marinicella marina]
MMKDSTLKVPVNIPFVHFGSLLLSLLLLMFCPLVAVAKSKQFSNKLNQDILKSQSFDQLSTVIATRPAGEFISLGADGDCELNVASSSLQQAIDTGVAEIRVASNGTYLENISIDNQSVVIRGGFTDCAAANSNSQTSNDLTVIDGANMTAPVIHISGVTKGQRQVVRLENLRLENGTSSNAVNGGGLSLDETDLELQLLRVLIINNDGTFGAGMNVDGGIGVNAAELDVFGQDVVVVENTSSASAGGLLCIGLADVTFTGMSLVVNNSAVNSAAGISMRNGCEISFYSELFAGSLTGFAGIIGNSANNDAGGVFATLGAKLYLFGQKMCVDDNCLGSNQQPITVINNVADEDDNADGDGGGIYLQESGFQTEAYGNGVVIDGNTAGGHGGGVFIGGNAKFTVERQVGGCWNKDRCNHIIANTSGDDSGRGGAFYVSDGGVLNIRQSYLEENRADFGTAIYATGQTAAVFVESSIFNDNGDGGIDGFSDFGVISAFDGAATDLRHVTIADNESASSVFGVGPTGDSSLTLLNSIVHDPGSGNLFGPDNGPISINCLIAHEANSYLGGQVSVLDPGFVDRLAGDFHLSSDSFAIDLCDGIALTQLLDIDVEARGWDDPTQINASGTHVLDAGADESYANDIIFADSF